MSSLELATNQSLHLKFRQRHAADAHQCPEAFDSCVYGASIQGSRIAALKDVKAGVRRVRTLSDALGSRIRQETEQPEEEQARQYLQGSHTLSS